VVVDLLAQLADAVGVAQRGSEGARTNDDSGESLGADELVDAVVGGVLGAVEAVGAGAGVAVVDGDELGAVSMLAGAVAVVGTVVVGVVGLSSSPANTNTTSSTTAITMAMTIPITSGRWTRSNQSPSSPSS
jgi:hypothetical protein